MKDYEQNNITINVNGIQISVDYKNIKNIHLSVYPPDGHVHLSAPMETSESALRLYILKKWVWLSEKMQKAKEHIVISERKFVSGEEHFWRGQAYRLKVVEDITILPQIIVNGDYLELYAPPHSSPAKRAQILNDWYRGRLNETLNAVVPKWEERLGVKTEMWDILKMRARWGTCNPRKKTVLFNLELAKKPCACVEYVVVHELAHLLERSHNDRFLQILQTYLPSWQEQRRQLNELPLSEELFQETSK